VYLNARSIINKFDIFQSWVTAVKPDLIGITETWANKNIFDSELALPGYDLFRKDRPTDREGGGVILYVNSDLHAVEYVPDSNFPEQIWCQILDHNRDKFYVGVCYRTPTVAIFDIDTNSSLRQLLTKLSGSNSHFMLMGDFNYPFSRWPPQVDSDGLWGHARDFCDCLEDNFLSQHVTIPTRNGHILDLVITDEPDMVTDVTDLGVLATSDHQALQWRVHVSAVSSVRTRQVFDYTRADICGIKTKLSKYDWEELFRNKSVEDSWSLFKDILHQLENLYVPIKKVNYNRGKPMWLSHKALKIVKHRHKIFRKYKDSSHPACKKANRQASKVVHQSRRTFESKLGSKIKDDKKSFFAYARCKAKSKVKVEPLVGLDGVEVEDTLQIAEVFNNQFSSVFTAENMTEVPCSPTMFTGSENDKLSDIIFTEDEVLKRLQRLREDKSAGVDDIASRFLKAICSDLATPVTLLFSRSMMEGIVPHDWKLANVTPIYKHGSKKLAENYRPISLTCHLSKVMESIVRDVITQHLTKFNLILGSQHGFRRGRSCVTNLLAFLDKVTTYNDDKDSVDIIFLDFAKAFDKVPHRRLMLKLKAHGIDGRVINWISNWLENRMQRVCINGTSSGWRVVLSGVPQGSVLGPLLFLIFINDLDLRLLSTILKFADDTKILGKAITPTDRLQLQLDLDELCKWAKDWQMKFNVSKCKVMHTGSSNSNSTYFMNGQQLSEVTEHKDLGIMISSTLKVADHCQYACNKANKMLGLLKRTIKHKNYTVMVQLYKSLVRPHLEYGSTAWNPHYSKDKAMLERVQHRFTRLFPDLRVMEYDARLEVLKLWTLEERRNRADLMEVYKMMHGFNDIPVTTYFQIATDSCTRGHNKKLVKRHCHTDARLYFFSLRVVTRWNSLPQETVDAPSVNIFKRHLDLLRQKRMGYFMDSWSA